jgi:hypothetical protein
LRLIERGAVMVVATASFTLVACDAVTLSPRQKVVKEATQAMCNARSLKGMLPFVTERSRPMIELASSMGELGSLLKGQNLADRIAVECAEGGPEFVGEIKVSETRYIVRTKAAGKGDFTETVVVREGDAWKIAMDGK